MKKPEEKPISRSRAPSFKSDPYTKKQSSHNDSLRDIEDDFDSDYKKEFDGSKSRGNSSKAGLKQRLNEEDGDDFDNEDDYDIGGKKKENNSFDDEDDDDDDDDDDEDNDDVNMEGNAYPEIYEFEEDDNFGEFGIGENDGYFGDSFEVFTCKSHY